MSKLSSRWKQWASYLRVETYTLYYLLRHPGVPWYARLAAVLVVGYAFSPIDLIPDFIPVLGYLDDLLIVPFGAWLALRLVPPAVLSAIIFPELLRPNGALDISFGNPRLLAGIIAALVAWHTKNALLTIGVGMAALWVLQAVI